MDEIPGSWGAAGIPVPTPKIRDGTLVQSTSLSTVEIAIFTLSSLRLIGDVGYTFCTRDQGLSKYAKIVGNGNDYPEI